MQNPYLVAQAQYGLGRIAVPFGDITEARCLGTDSLTTFEILGHRKAGEVRDWLHSLPGKENASDEIPSVES